MASFDQALAKTLANEGGFFHDPSTGEYAFKGVTIWTLRDLRWPGMIPGGREVPATPGEIQILRELSDADISRIYSDRYWYPQQLNSLVDQDLADKTFDLCVNLGCAQAGHLFQRALNRLIWPDGVSEDGIIGPLTTSKANQANAPDLLLKLRDEAEKFYRKLAQDKPQLAGNLTGWLRRLET